MNTDQRQFDWENILTKPVYTSDNKHVGHIDGLDDKHVCIKEEIIHARYYIISREILETYQHGKVKLRISEQELNSKYKKDRPMNF